MRLLAAFALFALPAAGHAAPVTVQVVGPDGQPLAGAVVTLTMPGVALPAPRGPYVMAQRGIAFDPHVLIVPVGATVSFPNFDKVRHHVYSFSKAKKFDLKLYGRDESRMVTFGDAGVVALGCNIHDVMNGVIYVAATPYAAVTDAQGRVTMTTGATGKATLAVWHPSIRAAGNQLSQPVSVGTAGYATTVTIRR